MTTKTMRYRLETTRLGEGGQLKPRVFIIYARDAWMARKTADDGGFVGVPLIPDGYWEDGMICETGDAPVTVGDVYAKPKKTPAAVVVNGIGSGHAITMVAKGGR